MTVELTIFQSGSQMSANHSVCVQFLSGSCEWLLYNIALMFSKTVHGQSSSSSNRSVAMSSTKDTRVYDFLETQHSLMMTDL